MMNLISQLAFAAECRSSLLSNLCRKERRSPSPFETPSSSNLPTAEYRHKLALEAKTTDAVQYSRCTTYQFSSLHDVKTFKYLIDEVEELADVVGY